MNTSPHDAKSRRRWTPAHEDAVRRLAEAAQLVQESDTLDSRQQLRSAVEAAREVGVGWTRIGDILGIASGNAYHRYRPRPCDAGTSTH